MKKILLVFLLLGLLNGCEDKPNDKKEKTEISSVNLTEAETYYNNGNVKYRLKN